MGEIADMMLEGDLCQECGEYMEGGGGYAKTCAGCAAPKKKENKPVQTRKCSAVGCGEKIPFYLMMCKQHWLMVPKDIQSRVSKFHRQGKKGRNEYLSAAKDAIHAVTQNTAG